MTNRCCCCCYCCLEPNSTFPFTFCMNVEPIFILLLHTEGRWNVTGQIRCLLPDGCGEIFHFGHLNYIWLQSLGLFPTCSLNMQTLPLKITDDHLCLTDSFHICLCNILYFFLIMSFLSLGLCWARKLSCGCACTWSTMIMNIPILVHLIYKMTKSHLLTWIWNNEAVKQLGGQLD